MLSSPDLRLKTTLKARCEGGSTTTKRHKNTRKRQNNHKATHTHTKQNKTKTKQEEAQKDYTESPQNHKAKVHSGLDTGGVSGFYLPSDPLS